MLESEAMALLVASGVSYKRRDAVIRLAGSALSVMAEPEKYAAQLQEKGTAQVRRAWAEREKLLGEIAEKGMRLILPQDAEYPPLLRKIAHPPHLLYVWGNPDLADPFPVASVGTRRASAYGVVHARMMARELAQAGVCVVSGLALGIDAASHEGALDVGGRTVAVLGGALDKLYPPENRGLMERILHANGSVVSEYSPGTAPMRYSFLQRNRIIAGMSLGVLAVEGAKRSGALRTAQCALEEGREVFALPGSVDSMGSELPHLLIADGARLVTCGRDILSTLVIEPKKQTDVSETIHEHEEEKPAPEEKTLHIPKNLAPEAQAICRRLMEGEADFDVLCAASGLSSDETGALLTELEMDEIVRQTAGDSYAPGAAMGA